MNLSRCTFDNIGIIDGLRRGERECIKPRAGDADLWIKIWEELLSLDERDITVEVEHVKAHRTKKEKKEMSHFLRRLSPKATRRREQCWTKGFISEARAEPMQQEREEVHAALQYAASFRCLVEEWYDCEERKPKPKEKWIFVDQKTRGDETSNGVVPGSQQVLVHEVWEEQQIHEDTRKVHRTKTIVFFF